MRLTEFISYINDEMPTGYISYHLDMTDVRQDKEVKAIKKIIKKSKKLLNKGRKDGTEDIDIFG